MIILRSPGWRWGAARLKPQGAYAFRGLTGKDKPEETPEFRREGRVDASKRMRKVRQATRGFGRTGVTADGDQSSVLGVAEEDPNPQRSQRT